MKRIFYCILGAAVIFVCSSSFVSPQGFGFRDIAFLASSWNETNPPPPPPDMVDPATITGLKLWYDAEWLTNYYADDAYITNWYDRNGTANPISSGLATNVAPHMKANMKNGLHVAWFDGNDKLEVNYGTIFPQPFWWFMVVCHTNITTTNSYLWDADGGGERSFALLASSDTRYYFNSGITGGSNDVVAVTNTWYLINGYHSNTASYIQVNGHKNTQSIGTNGLQVLALGNQDNAYYLHGYYAELFFITNQLYDSNVLRLQTWLSNKWDL